MLQSNIKMVLWRMEQLDKGIPETIHKALEPNYWKERFRLAAEREIKAQWASERSLALHQFYERITPQVVNTIMGDFLPEGGAWFSLAIPPGAIPPQPDIESAAQWNQETKTPSGRSKKSVADESVFNPEKAAEHRADWGNLERVRQIILDWVSLAKRKDERDYREDGTLLSDEEIARRVEFILGVGVGVVPRERDEVVQAAAQSLSGAIQRWLRGEEEGVAQPPYREPGAAGLFSYSPPPGAMLSPEVAEQWLRAVLLAWRRIFLSSFPNRLQLELDKLFKKLKQAAR